MNNSHYTHINLEYLYEVADGDADFIKEIITDYLTKVPDQFDQLLVVAEAGDIEAIKFIAHKMKSSFQFMGVQSLIELSQQIENAPDEMRMELFKQNRERMLPIVDEVLAELKDKLKAL